MTDATETIKKLAELKDPARFERLGTAFLKAYNPSKYAYTSHLGVNYKGSTVKAPLDSFSIYYDRGELCIAGAEYTVTELNALHDKFLKDLSTVKAKNPEIGATGNEGDLLKAINKIKEFRKEFPDIKNATVALLSTLDPKPETELEAHKLAKKDNIELEMYSGSTIAHFLDTKPEGQYLRKLYFGDEPDKLSVSLLKNITERQITQYTATFEAELIVQRGFNQRVFTNHTFIVGESGTGKSTIAFNTLKHNFEKDVAGIILSEKLVEESSSLEEALTKQLTLFEGNLSSDAGSLALDIGTRTQPIIIFIDDINNADSPVSVLKKLLKWIPISESKKWVFICPVHPVHLNKLDHNEEKKIRNLTLFVDYFSKCEAKKAIQLKALKNGIELSELDSESICASLGYDPLLISLCDLTKKIGTHIEIIENYIAKELQKVAAGFDELYEEDVKALLDNFVRVLLCKGNFRPSVQNLNDWYKGSQNDLTTLKKIFKLSSSVFVSKKNGSNFVSFRHDRVRLAMIADVITNDLMLETKPEYLSDPFYAEAIGLALVKIKNEPEFVNYLKNINPLSLFYALAFSAHNKFLDTNYLVKRINEWIIESEKNTLANEFVLFEAIYLLSKIDAKFVISICDTFTKVTRNEFWLIAKFRNGHIESGLNLVLRDDLGVTIAGRKALFDHIFGTYRDSYCEQIRVLLSSDIKQINTLNACLLLAGYIGDPSLEQSIHEIWTKVDDKKLYLKSFFWAVSRCYKKAEALLRELFDQWVLLPEVQEPIDELTLNSFACYDLSWAFLEYKPVNALAYFVQRASQDEKLEWPITFMIRDFEDLIAIEHKVNFLAKNYDKTKKRFSINIESIADNFRRENILSADSKDFLQKIIKDKMSPDEIRKAATCIYSTTADREDLAFLQTIDSNEPEYEWAIFERAVRGDLTTIDAIMELIPSNKNFWWQVGQYVWDERLSSCLAATISDIDQETDSYEIYILSKFLIKQEVEEISKVLLDNWGKVKYINDFLQAALFTANPRLVELFHREVEHSNNPKGIFSHILSHYGVKTKGENGITRLEQVEVLWKYRDYLSEFDILQLWEICNRNKWFDFRIREIDKVILTTTYTVILNLDSEVLENAYTNNNSISHWEAERRFEECIEAGLCHEDIVNFILDWFKSKLDLRSFQVVKYIASDKFSRKDIAALEQIMVNMSSSTSLLQNLDFCVKKRTLN